MKKLNKVLKIPRSPFYQPVDLMILNEVQLLVKFQVSHVKSQELKPDKLNRRFLVEAAYSCLDKQ